MSLSINLKNSLLLISERIIVLGMSFFISVMMARIAGPELFGQYAYITSFVALFTPLCAMGLNNISTKYFIKYPKHSHHLFLTALLLRGIGALFCILLGSSSAYLIGIKGEQLTFVITLLTLQSFSLFYLVEFFFLAKKQVHYTLRIRLLVVLCGSLTKLLIIIDDADLFKLLLIHGIEFIAIGLSYLILYYMQGHNVHQQRVKPVNIKMASSLFHKGKWLLLSGVAAAIYLKIDQVMLASFHGPEQVAFYAAAAKLSEFWYVFPVLIANAYNPKLIDLKQQNSIHYHNYLLKTLAFMVVISLTISIVMYIIASPLINFLYGEHYQSSASILSVHIFAAIFIFQRAFFSKWLIIENLFQFSLVTTSAGAVINILLNLYLIPKYSGLGAAWATFASYVVASYLSLYLYKETRPFFILMSKAMLHWPSILLKKRIND